MVRRRIALLLACSLLFSQAGCWSSKEIEDLSIYSGLALDEGKQDSAANKSEQEEEDYPKRNSMTATIQIVPTESGGSNTKQQAGSGQSPQFMNESESGDSVFEMMRQFSIRLERAVIGHHLKVIVVSTALARKYNLEQLMDFVLRDNDIRPSCIVFLSRGQAKDTFEPVRPGEVPSFKLKQMPRGHNRTGKVMKGVNLTKLDELLSFKQSFILQEITVNQGETEAAGAGIIKGETGKWIGSLNETDVESVAWIDGNIAGGTVKAYDWRDKTINYEIKEAKSKITPQVKNGQISFHVDIESKGRLIENWDVKEDPSKSEFLDRAEKVFEKRLSEMLDSVMTKLQSKYHADVIGFGGELKIRHPKEWKKVEDHWDDVFSRAPVTFDIKLKITDYGSTKK